ncbi:MFS transporter [Kitasatospora sp. NPDC052896]|uniref:MFS transporter n=1 Tax=Kitasatospora sp. NPDC052896 TaxID=3364061 RepID=UPI0037C75DF3
MTPRPPRAGTPGTRASLITAAVAAFMVSLDSTIVNLALPVLGRELGGGRADVEWVMDGYTLALAAVMLGAGALSDALGARRIFLLGLAVFGLASGACGLAGTMPVLIAARLVQGVGAALSLPSSLALVRAGGSSPAERGRAIALWSAAGGVGMAAGPLIGGAIVAAAGWRWVFWINVLVCPLALPATALLTRPVPARPRRLDLGGQLAATPAIAGLVFVLIEGPRLGWSRPAVPVASAVFVLGAAGFLLAERRAAEPLLPLPLARKPEFAGSAGLGALFNFAFYGLMFALSLLLQQVRGDSPLTAGLSFLPLTGLITAANLVAPRLTARRGSTFVLLVGLALFAAGLLGTALTEPLSSSLPLLLCLLPVGFGGGLIVPTMTTRLLESAPPELAGAASGAFNTARQVGGAVGVAVFGPLLGTGSELTQGFRLCVLLSVAAAALGALISATVLRRRPTEPAPGTAEAPAGQAPAGIR